jgi:GNAT superfamily N-acetyltransferase
VTIDFITKEEIAILLSLIKDLASYEKLEHEVVATEKLLYEWIFEKQTAEVLLAKEDNNTVGFMLFFHNFSTFLGRGGIYLEDFYVREEYRNKGYGKALFKYLAKIAIERQCGRIEWSCLDWNTSSIAIYKVMGATPMEGWTTYRLTVPEIEQLLK